MTPVKKDLNYYFFVHLNLNRKIQLTMAVTLVCLHDFLYPSKMIHFLPIKKTSL